MNAGLARAALLPACAVLVLLVWWPAMAGPFQFDDWWLVVANPATGGVGGWWQSLPGIRPLLKLSLALNAELAPAPWSYRAFNLAVHLGNAALVALLMARLLPVLAPAHPRPPLAALATALLFALHPATTEAVSYVSGRSISLMALPYLGALALIAGAPRDGRRADLAAALLFALALAVRETAVTLPAAAALVLRFKGESFRGIVWRLRWHLIVLGLALLAAALTPAYHSFFGWSLGTRSLAGQLLGQLEAHAYLLTRPLLGLHGNIDPDLRVPAGLEARHVLLMLSAAALALLAWRQRRRWPWLGFGLAWYLLHLLPSNSLLPRFDLANDRHLYLSLIGAAVLLAVPLSALRRPLSATVPVLALCLLLAAATALRNLDYRSELALWEATVRDSPDKARPWTNLGYARQLAGDLAGARQAYACALARDPGYRQAAWNLAALDEALEETPPDCRLP